MSNSRILHDWRFNIKLISLLLPLTYFCILQNKYEEYTSEVDYCIADKQSCTAPNEEYSFSDFMQGGQFQICTIKNSGDMCMDFQAYSCLYEIRNRHRDLILEEEVCPVYHNYFEYGVPIIVFTCLGSLGTLLFQSKILGISFIQDETAFSTVRATEFFVDKFISACAVLAFSLMIVSSQHYRLMMFEECDTSSRRGNFCRSLEQCHVEIRSIMHPTHWLAREFRVLVIVLALFVLVFELYCFIFPPDHGETEEPEDIVDNRIRQMMIRSYSSNSLGLEDSDHRGSSFVYVVQTPRGSLVNRRYVSSSSRPSPRASQTLSPARYMQQHQAFKHSHRYMFQRWNFHVAASTLGEDAECTICLESFHSKKRKKDDRKDDRNKAKGSTKVYPVECDSMDDDEGEKDRVMTIRNEDSETDMEQGETDGQTALDLQSIVRIPCGHLFHEICVFEWIRANSTCPVCRANTTTGEVADS